MQHPPPPPPVAPPTSGRDRRRAQRQGQSHTATLGLRSRQAQAVPTVQTEAELYLAEALVETVDDEYLDLMEYWQASKF